MMTEQEAIDAAYDYFYLPRAGRWDDSEEGEIVKALVEALEYRLNRGK